MRRVVIVVLALALVGCEAVPDITFAELDGGDAGDGSAADAGGDGATDAGIDGDAQTCTLLQGATGCCNGNPCAGDCATLCAADCMACSTTPGTPICCYNAQNSHFSCVAPSPALRCH
jgi:hypothetical protein